MRKLFTPLCLLLCFAFLSNAQNFPQKNLIPLPSKAQLRWQNYEQTMFVCLDPATWQGREYDNHSTPLNRINPVDLNTDQWCRVAKSWGAGLILFVAKHTGGFCWWQTNTTAYGIKNTPWKNGKGDVLKELSESCKKYGLDLGIYVYPGDETWGAGIGSGGITKDPVKQEGYNQVFREQMTEVLTKYGPVREVWFDGSCLINVNDILEKYASDATILQGPMANLRWVGNEDGFAPFSNWYTLNWKDLKTGVSTAVQSDPFGDAYAPVEIDVPLLKNKGHKWFWGANSDSLILSTDQLMNLYYKSVGRGALLLLNSTPDTTGLIPQSHVKAYAAFGDEIHRRFNNPVGKTFGNEDTLVINFSKPTQINHAILQEDLSKGQRVLAFHLEGAGSEGIWHSIYSGTSIGHKRIVYFDSQILNKIRVVFTNVKAIPQIKNFTVYNVKGAVISPEKRESLGSFYDGLSRKNGTDPQVEPVIEIGKWDAGSDKDKVSEVSLDLTKYVTKIGQYEIIFNASDQGKPSGIEFSGWQLEMYGGVSNAAVELLKDKSTFRITRSQQTLDEFPTRFRVKIGRISAESSGKIFIKRQIY